MSLLVSFKKQTVNQGWVSFDIFTSRDLVCDFQYQYKYDAFLIPYAELPSKTFQMH